MDYFIDQVRILMPVLGYDIFRGRDAAAPSTPAAQQEQGELGLQDAAADSPQFRLRTGKGIDAHAQVIDGEFTVLKGSVVSAEMRKGTRQAASTARQFANRELQHDELMKSAVTIPDTQLARLSKDVVYNSPSAAAAVTLGRASSNGRIEWVAATGQTYGSWEASQASV